MKWLKKSPFSINLPFIIVVIVLGTFAYAKPGRILNEILILLLIISGVDAVYFLISALFVRISLVQQIVVEKGKSFEIEISISNEAGLISPFIYIMPEEGQRIGLCEQQTSAFLLGPKEQLSYSVEYEARFSGVEELGVKAVTLKSFMGFFKKKVEINNKAEVKILPEIRLINGAEHFNIFLQEGVPRDQGEKADSLHNGHEIGYELRPYMEGDSQNLIHWKLAALKDEYLVRQREGEKAFKREMLFILNPFIHKDEKAGQAVLHDKTLTSFLSIAAYYLSKGERVKAVYYKEREWQYIILKSSLQLRSLQENLCEYREIEIEDNPNQKGVIKSLMKMTGSTVGAKVLISSCWHPEIEKYFLIEKINPEYMPVIWTGHELTADLVKSSQFYLWYMTDEFSLVCGHESV